MDIRLFKHKHILCYMILFIQTYGLAQVYIFEGDPDLILEQGTYKQNYNTGMYFYHMRHWEDAIIMLDRCSALTRKKTKHIFPLMWSYIYNGDYENAIKILEDVKDNKKKRLIRLVIRHLNSVSENDKLIKEDIDKILLEKKKLISRMKEEIAYLSKHSIINYQH